MINRLKLFLKEKKLLKSYLISSALKNDLLQRKEIIKNIWNKDNVNIKIFKHKKKENNNNKKSIFNFSVPRLKISIPKLKLVTKVKTKNKRIKSKNNLKSNSILLLDKFNKKLSLKSLKNYLSSKINLNYYNDKLEQYLKFNLSDVIKKFKSKKLSEKTKSINLLVDLIGIYFVNNKLYFAHLQRRNNSNYIKDIAKINTPSDLIGDYKIEKIPEFKRMLDDMINVFELNNPPIILLLSSSFFTTRSFSDSELIVFSEEDPIILSKSPYLPDNTLLQYKRVNGDKNSSYHRVVYANKEVIDSWVNALTLTKSDIATVTCPAIHFIEKLSLESKKEIFVLCDVEEFITSVYVLRNNCQLFSERLPFGTSVYITGQESLNDQFFSRLESSVKTILSKNKLSLDENIYLNGNGIDKMFSINKKISKGFTRIPKTKYELNPERVSDFNDEDSVLNSFSQSLDILIKKEIEKEDNKDQIYRGQKYVQKKEVDKEVFKSKENSLTFRGKNYKG